MSNNFWNQRKPLFEVLLLMVLIITVFTCYGLAKKPFSFETVLEQANVKSLFERDSVPDKNIDSLLIAANKIEDETEDSPVDSTSKYILLCGDSMTEQMRFAWEEFAKKNGHKIMTCTWYSSTTLAWGDTKRLTTLIKEYKPDIIWFTLGSNELFIQGIAKREKFIKSIIAEADSAKVPFIWIGPPNWKDDSGINEIIERNIGKSRFYNSSHFREKLARGKDGAHPTKAAAAIWADSIAVWHKTECLYRKKLLLVHPKDSMPARPYAPTTAVCAPARENKFTVRILNQGDVTNICKDDAQVVQPDKKPAENKNENIPVKKDPIKPIPPLTKDTQKTVPANVPKDSIN